MGEQHSGEQRASERRASEAGQVGQARFVGGGSLTIEAGDRRDDLPQLALAGGLGRGAYTGTEVRDRVEIVGRAVGTANLDEDVEAHVSTRASNCCTHAVAVGVVIFVELLILIPERFLEPSRHGSGSPSEFFEGPG